jgi:hypothetical protein
MPRGDAEPRRASRPSRPMRHLATAGAVLLLAAAFYAVGSTGAWSKPLVQAGNGVGGGHGPHIPLHRHILLLVGAVLLAILVVRVLRLLWTSIRSRTTSKPPRYLPTERPPTD